MNEGLDPKGLPPNPAVFCCPPKEGLPNPPPPPNTFPPSPPAAWFNVPNDGLSEDCARAPNVGLLPEAKLANPPAVAGLLDPKVPPPAGLPNAGGDPNVDPLPNVACPPNAAPDPNFGAPPNAGVPPNDGGLPKPLPPDVNPLKPVDPVLPLPLLKAPPVPPENEPPADEVAAFPNVLAPPLPNKPELSCEADPNDCPLPNTLVPAFSALGFPPRPLNKPPPPRSPLGKPLPDLGGCPNAGLWPKLPKPDVAVDCCPNPKPDPDVAVPNPDPVDDPKAPKPPEEEVVELDCCPKTELEPEDGCPNRPLPG